MMPVVDEMSTAPDGVVRDAHADRSDADTVRLVTNDFMYAGAVATATAVLPAGALTSPSRATTSCR